MEWNYNIATNTQPKDYDMNIVSFAHRISLKVIPFTESLTPSKP
jgi:hypothetical protein